MSRLRIAFIFLLSVVSFSACEKDDICTQNPLTPNLVLRFYDVENPLEFKDVISLYVWAKDKDTLADYKKANTDSIAIPLNSDAKETIYKLSNGTDINELRIVYTTEAGYVSRSCGFKIIYNDLLFNSDNTWIASITPENLNSIENQNAAHVQIFH